MLCSSEREAVGKAGSDLCKTELVVSVMREGCGTVIRDDDALVLI